VTKNAFATRALPRIPLECSFIHFSLLARTFVDWFAKVIQVNGFMRKIILSTKSNKSTYAHTVFARGFHLFVNMDNWTLKSLFYWGWCKLGESCFVEQRGMDTPVLFAHNVFW